MLVFRGQKNENSPQKTGCARPLLKKKSQAHFSSSSSSSAVFVENSVTPMSTLANNKRSCSKKWKKHAKMVFFLFFRRKLLHDFVTPFSTFANIKGSLSTESTTHDRLRCRARPSDDDFTVFWGEEKHNKKVFFSCPPSSGDLHPKRSPSPGFCDRGVSNRVKNAGQKKFFSWRGELQLVWYLYLY